MKIVGEKKSNKNRDRKVAWSKVLLDF